METRGVVICPCIIWTPGISYDGKEFFLPFLNISAFILELVRSEYDGSWVRILKQVRLVMFYRWNCLVNFKCPLSCFCIYRAWTLLCNGNMYAPFRVS